MLLRGILRICLAAIVTMSTACAADRHHAADRPDAADRARAAVNPNDRPMSTTVIGERNPLLADGATALQAGNTDDGIRLTLEGLKLPNLPRDVAAAHANLCAGYVMLRRYDEALVNCNTAISMDPTNWRAYNNRAAAYAAQGLYDLAIADVTAGLKIAPDSAVLHKSLAVIRHNEALQRRHRRSFRNA
jgi:tetratricopeptide (TPR) repeat protein